MNNCIAIDGPAGAGKSTIAKLIAKKAKLIYVDTGAMYRALAVYFIRQGLAPSDEAGISAATKGAEVTIKYIDGAQHVILNGEDVTSLLRTEETGNMASSSSAYAAVRGHLLELQRSLAADTPVVMDGRDIGTVVLPGAALKIFLTASVDVRARRRVNELKAKGENPDMEQIRADIEARDYRDSHREIAPLKQAEDAVLIDSSDMTIDEVVDTIIKLYEERVS